MRTLLRRQFLLVGFLWLLLSSPSARANVYATDIKLNGSLHAGIVVPGASLTISYILNDNATAGVSVRIYSDSNVIKTFSAADGLPGTFAGLNSFAWDGTASNGLMVSPGVYNVSITAAAAGYDSWTPITDDSTNFSVFYPSGMAVNKNTNSPYYGRVFVGNCAFGGNPTQSPGIFKYNADGSPADEGRFGAGGYLWSGNGYDDPSPWKMGISSDDRLYVDDWTYGGVVLSFDQVLSTNFLPVLTAGNYPYSTILLSGPFVAGAGANTQIWMADVNPAFRDGLGVLRWFLTADGEAATNDTGTVIVGLGQGSSLTYAPFDVAVSTNGFIYVIQQVSVDGSPLYQDTDAAHMRLLCFPPYLNGSPPETNAVWQVGSYDPTLENAYGVAVDPTATFVAVAARGEGSPGALEFGGLSIFLAANGTLATNISQDPEGDTNQQMVAVAWDNVGNLYAAEWTSNVWRVYSPPGPNQATTVAVPVIQALNALLPATLSDTSFAATASALNFSLQGQSNVTYVIEQSPDLVNWMPVATNYSPDPERAISLPLSPTDGQDFYRAVAAP